MRVKRFAQGLLAVQAVMVVALGLSTYLLERQLELLNHSRDVAFQSYLLADELRQGSDDLTRLARAYVVTGDPELEREYWAVLDIRNGKLARPKEYNRIYWDLVTAENPRPRPLGETVPLRQLMIDEGFTPVELAKLDEAQQHSDALVRTETVAMNAAKGLFDDGSGHFTLKRHPDRDLGIRLLHDDAYREAKRRIMQPIDEFYAMFEARTTGAVFESLARSRSRLQWLSVLLTATLALFVGSFAALLRQGAQRERAQRDLAESEARYRTIFFTAADGFGLVDKDARLLEVNPAFCRMSGYSAEELRTMRVSDLEVGETEITEHLEHARRYKDERFSSRLRCRGGGTVDVEISTQYRAIDSGRFVMLVRDVTELRQAQAAKRESEEMLLSAFLASPAAIWISEGQDANACAAINDAFERMTGFSREDVIGKTGDEISLYEHPRDRDLLVEKLLSQGSFRDAELRFRKKNGELRDGVFNAQVSRVGDKAYVLVVLTDVTEAKRSEREREQLLRVETLMAELAASFVDAPDEALDEVVQDALRRICECFDLDMASIWQPEHGAPEQVLRTHVVFAGEPSVVAAKAALTDFPWLLQLSRTNKTTIIPDVAAIPEPGQHDRQKLSERGVTNLVSIPWCTAPDRLDGVLFFGSSRSRELDTTTVSQLETLSRTILVVLSRARERRATAEARQRMRTQLEMLDDAPAGITINSKGAFLYANKAAVTMHGYTSQEFATLSIAELVAPEDQSRIAAIRQAIVEQGSQSFTIWHRRKDGTRLHLDTQARRSKWLGQDVNISVFVDLSERERAASELRQSEDRYRLLAENISDVISVLDLESERFEYVSPSVLRLRGYTADEAIGQRLETTLTADSLVHARRRIAELLEAERTGQDPATAENDGSVVYQQLRKDGSTVPTEVRARILHDPTSGKLLLLSVARDISERQKAQKEREDLQQQLYQSQKMEAIGGLAGGVAHDFNNLLSVIMSYTDFVVDKLPEDDRRRTDLLEVQKASDRAAALVRQLLAFSRKQILEPRMIDLNQVVSGVEKMLRRLVGEDVQLEVTLGEGLGSVLADAGQVEQVIMNLAVNARDAMPTGGRLNIQTINVQIPDNDSRQHSKVKPGRYVAFTVADTGSGMDEVTVARAFEPFFYDQGTGQGHGARPIDGLRHRQTE